MFADDVVRRSAVTGAAVPLGRGVVGDRGEVGLVDDSPRERGPAGEGEGHPAPAGQQGDVGLAGAADGPDLGRQVARAGREDRQETGEAALDRLDVDDGGLVDPDARPSPGRVVDLDGEDGALREARERRGRRGGWRRRASCVEVVVVGEGAGATAVVGPRVRRAAARSRRRAAGPPSPRHLAASGRGGRLAHCGHGNQRSVGSDTVREPRSSGWVDPVDHPAQAVVADLVVGPQPLGGPTTFRSSIARSCRGFRSRPTTGVPWCPDRARCGNSGDPTLSAIDSDHCGMGGCRTAPYVNGGTSTPPRPTEFANSLRSQGECRT